MNFSRFKDFGKNDYTTDKKYQLGIGSNGTCRIKFMNTGTYAGWFHALRGGLGFYHQIIYDGYLTGGQESDWITIPSLDEGTENMEINFGDGIGEKANTLKLYKTENGKDYIVKQTCWWYPYGSPCLSINS
jgi:hypothetical protein